MRLAPRAGPRLLALAATLAPVAWTSLAGCARDLDLPGVPTSPTVTGFFPTSAFGGQLVRITGVHFAGVAAENTVHFAYASARGERLESGALLVRVPANAGDGPITVSNREGTSSASADPFDYLGLGEPGRLQVNASSPILQQPTAVHAFPNGEVVLGSGLYGGLLVADRPDLAPPPATLSAADAGRLYFVEVDAAGIASLTSLDASTWAQVAKVTLASEPRQLLALAGQNRLLLFGEVAGEAEVTALDATTLATVLPATNCGVGDFWGAADLRNGRAVVASYTTDLQLFLLDFTALPVLPAAVPFGCGSYSGACPPALGVDHSYVRVPLASAGDGAGTIYVAAPLDDGNAILARASGGTPEFEAVVDTFSPSPIESLAATASFTLFVATKPADDLALGFTAGGSLRWFVDAAGATVSTAVSFPAAMDTRHYAFVAGGGSNDVLVVDMATGQRVSRIPFDVAPGAQEDAGAMVFVPSSAGGEGELLFPATAYPGFIRLPLTTDPPTALARTPDIAFLCVAPDAGAVWSAAAGPPPRVEGWLGYDAGAWTSRVSVALDDAPQRLAALGARVAVGHGAGLSIVDGASPPSGTAATAAIPGIDFPAFLGMGFTPAGEVWALVTDYVTTEAQLWAPADIGPGGAPTAVWSFPDGARSAAWLEDGLWVFWDDAGGAPRATLLDAALGEVRTVASSDRLLEVDAISPNGRLLVDRAQDVSLGFPVRFFRADPDAGFPEVGSVIFNDRVAGFAFDATGERLYVVTQNPDRIVTVD
jgi:hypothetical protein